jgi:hypothetical protein
MHLIFAVYFGYQQRLVLSKGHGAMLISTLYMHLVLPGLSFLGVLRIDYSKPTRPPLYGLP